MPGLLRDCTWAERTKGSGCRWGAHSLHRSQPELVGLWHGRMQLFGCRFSRLILNSSRAGFLVLGMVGMPSQKMRWHWALLQHGQASAGEPRSCCRGLWLLQKDAFGKGEVLLFSAACQEAPLVVLVRALAWQREMGKVERAIESRLACALQRPGWHGVLIPSGPLFEKLIVQHQDTSVPPCFMQPLTILERKKKILSCLTHSYFSQQTCKSFSWQRALLEVLSDRTP